jgi:hypothetical protein
MRTLFYTNIPEAFRLMNQSTDIRESYEVRFAGKEVTSVSISSNENTPVMAAVFYKIGAHMGIDFIDLTQKRSQ